MLLVRILRLYAEENAVDDTIYYLGEALRKGGIELDVFLKVSQVPRCSVSGCTTIHPLTHITVEPLNKGHFGSASFVLYLEAVLWWEVRIIIVSTTIISISAIAGVLYLEVVLWWEGPL